MQRNEIVELSIAVIVLLYSSGCASLTPSKPQATQTTKTIKRVQLRDSENPEIVYSNLWIEDETYFDILNRQAKERGQRLRYHSKWKTTRHIGFFGTLSEYERQLGAKIVLPW